MLFKAAFADRERDTFRIDNLGSSSDRRLDAFEERHRRIRHGLRTPVAERRVLVGGQRTDHRNATKPRAERQQPAFVL